MIDTARETAFGLVGLAGMALVAFGLATPARGEAGVSAANDARTGAVMVVPVNKSQTLRVDRAYAKAIIGNPEIADVLPLSLSSVYVLGKAIGSTNLSLYDRGGGLIAVVDLVIGPDVQGLKRKLNELMPTERVGVTASNDSLVIDGKVSSAAAADRIATIAETFAPKKVLNMMSTGSPQQVLLEVRFSEMSRGTVRQLGITNFSFAGSGAAGVIAAPSDLTDGPFQSILNIFGSGLSIQLDALEQNGLVHTLAQPNLMALSGETANFLAGGEFPVPVSSDTDKSGVSKIGIEFKQFGVALAFTPTVLEDGIVNLLVAPEVSSLDRNASIQLFGFNIPGLKVRRAKTTVELRDGQSFAIAGLIQNDFNDTIKKVPLLGNVPIIGALFRSTKFNRNETELVITVTPHIVRPVAPAQIAYPTDRVKQPNDLEFFLLGKSEARGTAKALPVPANGQVKPGGIDGDYGQIVK